MISILKSLYTVVSFIFTDANCRVLAEIEIFINLYFVILILWNIFSCYIWLSWCAEFGGLMVPTKTMKLAFNEEKKEFIILGNIKINFFQWYQNLLSIEFCIGLYIYIFFSEEYFCSVLRSHRNHFIYSFLSFYT